MAMKLKDEHHFEILNRYIAQAEANESELNEPKPPPTPLPGGHGPTEALTVGRLVEALRKLSHWKDATTAPTLFKHLADELTRGAK